MNLVEKLTVDELALARFRLTCISPIDGKYGKKVDPVRKYLSAEAEWLGFAFLQRTLLETRVEFGAADQKYLDEVDAAMPFLDPLNMALLEDEVTHHDQLAVLEEFGRHISLEAKAVLHPGTTSQDIIDTTRSYLYKKAWYEAIRPTIVKGIEKLCQLGEHSLDILQVGRTHLQDTSPVLFGGVLAGYAARLSERMSKCDVAANDLRGKISGIVGTGASIEMVVGEGKAMKFETAVLEKLGLIPDYTSTQIVQKERLADFGHGIATLMGVLGDFAHDMRLLYSSALQEVTSRDNAERLGGSSADATKNNPIDYENIEGNSTICIAGMPILYALIQSDFARDLRGSVEERYQPRIMLAQAYESFSRLVVVLNQFSINTDRMSANLYRVRQSPSEALVAILRGEGWVHSKYGEGHHFIKEMGKTAILQQRPLREVCRDDPEFALLYDHLPKNKQRIINGELELYLGDARQRAYINIGLARSSL